MPIKLANLIKPSRKDLKLKTKKPAVVDPPNSELTKLLKNTSPRNIPKAISEKFGSLSQSSIKKMIQDVSVELKSASGNDKAILETALASLKNLIKRQ